MRAAAVLLPALLLAAAEAAAQGTSDWRPFTSKEGRFTVLLPAEPAEAGAGPRRDFEVRSGGRLLHVHYHDLAAPAASEAAAEEALDRAEAAANAIGLARMVRMVQKKKVSLEGHPGREFLVDYGGRGYGRYRAFVTPGRLYTLGLDGAREAVTSADADAFLDSFRLTGPAPAPAPKPPAFRPFTCREGGFTVLLPGTPEEKRTTDQSALGPVVSRQLCVQGDGKVWMVVYHERSPILHEPALPGTARAQRVLAEAVKGWGESLGTVLSEKALLAGEAPGREALMRRADGSCYMRARCYLQGWRPYQVMVAGPLHEVMSPDADRYLDSFQLLK